MMRWMCKTCLKSNAIFFVLVLVPVRRGEKKKQRNTHTKKRTYSYSERSRVKATEDWRALSRAMPRSASAFS